MNLAQAIEVGDDGQVRYTDHGVCVMCDGNPMGVMAFELLGAKRMPAATTVKAFAPTPMQYHPPRTRDSFAGLSTAMRRTIRILRSASQPLEASQLAERLAFDQSRMYPLLKELTELGYVAENDTRPKGYTITDAGTKVDID